MLLEASARLDLYPSVDGTTVKGNELELVARGEYVGNLSGLIIGDNDDEGTVFAAGLGLTNPRAVGAFYESFGPEINATLHELYPIGTTNRSAFAAASNVLGDALFYVPIREFAIAAAGNITDQLFKYRFSGIVSSAQVPGLPLGSFHGVELPYVFNASNFLNASEQLTADNMVHLWTSFASGLLPPSASGNDSVPAWPAYQGPGGEVLQIGPEGGTLRIVPDSQLKHFNESTYNLLVEMLGVGVAGASGSAAQRPAAEDWAIGRLLLAAGNRDGEWKGRKRLWQM
ncbi:Alpha/Beta hydrolase protein [Hyaloraphidium curvatum]|nr:Alpha/Beta hydrolase protein [Hyaloraphidium curvatum]